MRSAALTGSISPPQPAERQAMDAREQRAVAPFLVGCACPGSGSGRAARRRRARAGRARSATRDAGSPSAPPAPPPSSDRGIRASRRRWRAARPPRSPARGARRALPAPAARSPSARGERQPHRGRRARRRPGATAAGARPRRAPRRHQLGRPGRPARRLERRRAARRRARAARRAARRRRARRARPAARTSAIAAGVERAEAAGELGIGLRAATRRGRGAPRAARRRERCTGSRCRISCDSGDGADVSMATVRIAPSPIAREHAREAVDVHRLVQAVVDRLRHQRMVGDRDRAGAHVVARTPSCAGKTAASRSSARMRWSGIGTFRPPSKRSSASARVAFQRQRVPNIGAASAACARSSRSVVAPHHREHAVEREAVLLAEREDDAVVGRRRLQLEVEADAEALAQREAEARLMRPPNGACRTSCMPPASSKKRSATTRRERRHARRARPAPRRRSATSCAAPARRQAALARRASGARRRSPLARRPRSRRSRHRRRQLARARRRLAEPERDRRRRAVRVLDAHRGPPRRGGCATSGCRAGRCRRAMLSMAKSSFTVPTSEPVRLLDDLVVGGVGDRAAAGDRGEPRAAARAQAAVHAIAVQVRRAPAAPRRDALGEHARARRRSRRAADRGTGYARRTSANSSSTPISPAAAIATNCCARMSSGPAGTASASSSPARTARTAAAACTSSSRVSGKTMPFGIAPSAWPERPTRWSSVASARGAPRWQTRSTCADVDAELERRRRDHDRHLARS